MILAETDVATIMSCKIGAGIVLTLKERPLVTNIDLALVPVSARIQTASECFLGRLHNGHVHMLNSVNPNSRAQYEVGFRRWQRFTAESETSWDMVLVPPGVSEHLDGLSFPEACVVGFLSFLRDGGDDNAHIESSAVSNYLAGTRFYLKNRNMDTRFVDTSVAIKTTKQGMLLQFRAQAGNKVADRKRLPFTLHLIQVCIMQALDLRLTMDQLTKLALEMGIGFIFRKCEYIKTKGTDHHLRAMDVTFVFRLTPDMKVFVLAHLAYDMDVSALVKVIVLIRSAKNDHEGCGNNACVTVPCH